MDMTCEYDVVIAGARPAGTATALLLARAGVRVLVVERDTPGTDTLSTHALMRGGVMQLTRWGVADGLWAAGTPRVRQTRFVYGTEEVVVDISDQHGVDALMAPRRTVLDPALAAAAAAAGAEIRYGALFDGVPSDDADGRVTAAVVAATAAVAGSPRGAGGRRRRAALARGAGGRCAGDAGRPAGSGDDLRLFRGNYRHRLPLALRRPPRRRGDPDQRRTARSLRRPCRPRGSAASPGATAARRCVRSWRRCIPASPRRSRPAGMSRRRSPSRASRDTCGDPGGRGGRWSGDAGYFKDPITAHGITDALRDAELLATRCLAGTEAALAAYEATRDRLSRPLFAVTDALAALDWTLRRRRRACMANCTGR